MHAFRHGTGSRRTLVIVLLLAACVAVMGILAFQTDYAVRSHRSMAESVLRDYAALAAGELQRRVTTDVGYRGCYRLVTALRREAGEKAPGSTVTGTEDAALQEAAPLAKQFFRDDGVLVQRPVADEAADEASRRWLEALLAATRQAEGDGDRGFAGHHLVDGDRPVRTFVVAAESPGQPAAAQVGFEIDRRALGSWTLAVFERQALLPPSLAGGELGNEIIHLRLSDPADHELLVVGRPFSTDLAVESIFDDAYGGIFEGYRLRLALDPAAASSLVIGGLPASRLPLLLGLLALTLGLMAAAVWLLQRERAVHRLRSNFVSRVSHELRTPLTQIRMFSETLLLGRTRNPDEARGAVEIIDREARRLTHLVENLLQFSRGERGELAVTLRRRPLAPLVRQVAEEFEPLLADGRGTLRLDLEGEPEGRVDEDSIRQILLNLLDNAFKYGPHGQQIRIGLRAAGDVLRLSVEDEGPGIPEARRQDVWDRYYRLGRDRRSSVAGTGIGLTVVRELAQLHGGRCRVEDGGGGARVVVELPAMPRDPGGDGRRAEPGEIP